MDMALQFYLFRIHFTEVLLYKEYLNNMQFEN